jgi:anti-sigma-K factor RskA
VTPDREDPHTLAGAYSMDAIDGPDRVRFEQHLAGCESCRQEIRGLREAAAALAAATAVEPPAALRHAVLHAAARTRQLPPIMSPNAEPVTDRRTQYRGWRAWANRPGPTRWAPKLLAGLATALVVLAVVFGVASYAHMQGGLDQAQNRDHTVAAVLSASDAQMVSGHVSTGGTATVVMSHRMGMLVFTAADLRALPTTKGYELWLIGPSGSRAAGMLSASGHGKMVGPMVVSGISGGDRVGLTVEPVGGSPRPTSRLILLL